MLDVHALLAVARDAFLALPVSEVERLVAVHVDTTRREVRQELREQLERERGVLRRRREHRRLHPVTGDRLEAVGRLRPAPVRLVREPARHVPEAVLVGHELDAVLGAERVEPPHVLRRDRRRVAPHDLVVGVRERVLGVELDVVDARDRADADEPLERVARRDAIPAHVEHVAAHREVRPVADANTGQPRRVVSGELRESRPCVAQPALVPVCDPDATGGGLERVAVGPERRIVLHVHRCVRRCAGTRLDQFAWLREQHVRDGHLVATIGRETYFLSSLTAAQGTCLHHGSLVARRDTRLAATRSCGRSLGGASARSARFGRLASIGAFETVRRQGSTAVTDAVIVAAARTPIGRAKGIARRRRRVRARARSRWAPRSNDRGSRPPRSTTSSSANRSRVVASSRATSRCGSGTPRRRAWPTTGTARRA